jgi:hypothetical protein
VNIVLPLAVLLCLVTVATIRSAGPVLRHRGLDDCELPE